MQKPYLLKVISTQRAEIRVIGVGGDERILQRGRIPHSHDDGGVAEHLFIEPELYKISRLHLLQGGIDTKGTGRLPYPGNEVVEILHPGPRGRLLVGIDIIPAENGLKIHHTRPGVEAL